MYQNNYHCYAAHSSYAVPRLTHPARSRNSDKGLGLVSFPAPTDDSFTDSLTDAIDLHSIHRSLSSTTMSSYSLSPYRLPHILSPARSTPSLDDSLDDNFFSPPENHLDTPDLNSFDWKEIRRLEDHKLYLEEREAASLTLYDFELPSLEEVSPGDASLGLGLSSAPTSWQPPTITPAEAFYDYDEVRRYLAEQARPSSPAYSVCSSYLATPYSDTKELPSIDGVSQLSYPVELPSPESAVLVSSPDIQLPVPAVKRSREEVDDEDYHEDEDDDDSLAPQRGRVSKRQRRKVGDFSDPDVGIPEREQSADDDDDEFKPRSLSIKRHGANKKQNRRSQKPPVKARSQPQSGADNSYRLGPCDCRQANCANCEMTCFYTFIRGPRKGRVCKRLFESGRHLDLRRHKISHAVNEWQMLQDGEITLEEAWWYAVEHKCEYQGLICPNGDCKTTFTRYDALRRHMERQTCPYWQLSSYLNLDNRSVKAQIERASKEKYKKLSASKQPS